METKASKWILAWSLLQFLPQGSWLEFFLPWSLSKDCELGYTIQTNSFLPQLALVMVLTHQQKPNENNTVFSKYWSQVIFFLPCWNYKVINFAQSQFIHLTRMTKTHIIMDLEVCKYLTLEPSFWNITRILTK